MIKTTIGTILAEEVDAGDDKRIYLIRDKNFPIYIGQAMYVCERITDHCGLGPRIFQPDQLGDFILNNQPDSLGWQVDLLTLDECELIARQYFPSYSNFDIDIIEQALINAFGPCLNTFHNQNNPNRKSIPAKYLERNTLKNNKELNKNDIHFLKTTSQAVLNKSNINHTFGDKPINQNAFFQYRQHLSPHTVRSLLQTLTVFQEYLNNIEINISNTKGAGNITDDPNAWRSVTTESITAFIQWLIAQGFAISTINLRISFIKKYAKIAFQAGTLSEDEWKKISDIKNIYSGKAKRIDAERKEKNIPTRVGRKVSQELFEITNQQAQELKSFSEDNPDGRRANLLMSLLLDQGLQATDVSKINMEDFDLVLGILNLKRSNMGKQALKLSPDSLRAIKCILDNHDIKASGPLGFRIRKNGKTVQQPIDPPLLRYYVRTAGKSIGIKNLTVQQCRSYWVKKEIENGANVLDIQAKGGWTNIQSVLRNIKITENTK